MRRPSPALLIFVYAFVISLCLPAWSNASDNLDITGFIESKNRLTIEDADMEFNFVETIFGMRFSAFPADKVSLVGGFELIAIPVDERLDDDRKIDIEQQQDRSYTDPVRVQIDEAYMLINGLGLKNLDLKLGKQRIFWGTGDQFNPTDNLNPDDLHDPLDFGKKVPSLAAQFNYYAGPVTFTAVILPLFDPVLLPETDIRAVFEKRFDTMASEFEIDTGNISLDSVVNSLMLGAIQGAEIGDISVVSQLPDRNFENARFAFKVAGAVGQVDMSASYAYARDDFGVPSKVNITVDPFATGTKIIDKVNLDVEQKFPRTHIIGADFSTSIPVLDIGFWGEAAYFIPKPMDTEYFLDTGSVNKILSSIGNENVDHGLVIAKDEPTRDHYIKAVTGFDYTFPGAWYMNMQYIRGLPSDNTAETVDDYAFGGFDKPFFHDTIKPRIFSGVCFQDQSWVLYPQVFLYPMDALEIHVGAFLVFGEVDTKYGAFGDDILFARFKLSF